MKDKIATLKKTFNEGLELLKEQKVDEAVAKMAEVAPVLDEMEASADTTAEELQKTAGEGEQKEALLKTAQETITKQAEQLQKWADMFVSAESLQALLDDLKGGQNMLKTLETKVEELSKTATSRQVSGETLTKTKEEILADVKLG